MNVDVVVIIARRHTRQNQSKCEKFSVLRLPTHLFWVSVEWKLFCTHINGNHLNIRWKPNQILNSRMSILRLNFNQMYTLKGSELNAEHNVVTWQHLSTAKILHGTCSRDLLNTTMSWIIEVCHQAQFLTLKYLYALTLYDCGFLFHSTWEHMNLMTPKWEKNHHLFELWICSRNGYYNGYIPRSVAGESSITNFSQSNYRFVWLVFEWNSNNNYSNSNNGRWQNVDCCNVYGSWNGHPVVASILHTQFVHRADI